MRAPRILVLGLWLAVGILLAVLFSLWAGLGPFGVSAGR